MNPYISAPKNLLYFSLLATARGRSLQMCCVLRPEGYKILIDYMGTLFV